MAPSTSNWIWRPESAPGRRNGLRYHPAPAPRQLPRAPCRGWYSSLSLGLLHGGDLVRVTLRPRRAMTCPLLALLVFLPAVPVVLAADDPASAALEKTVRARLDVLDAQSTLYAKHLGT